MERYSKLGLPVLVGGLLLFIFAMKSFVNIGYGEAGVLFKTFGGGVVTDEPPKGEGFHIIAPWNDLYVYNVKQQEVFESKKSRIFEQAENRMHAQQALLSCLLS